MTLTSPELYLVRHGETAWSRIRRLTSVTDLDLTDVGVAQASSLCGHLDPAAFGLVLSSPRRRAQRTAQLAGFDPARVVVADELAETPFSGRVHVIGDSRAARLAVHAIYEGRLTGMQL